MKKRGFTVSEIMVALAMIGIIGSLTIPTFISSNKNKANASKLATTISAVENGFTNMIVSEAVQNLSETRFGRIDANNSTDLAGILGDYLKLNGDSAFNDYGFNLINGDTLNNFNGNRTLQLKNGALLMYQIDPVEVDENDARNLGGTITGSTGKMLIDINAENNPNTVGRDIFYFRVGDDGLLYPAGGLNFSILEEGHNAGLWRNGGEYSCNDNNKQLGCTARLIENNYEVDY